MPSSAARNLNAFLCGAAAFLLTLSACSAPSTPPQPPSGRVRLAEVAAGFDKPVGIVHAGDARLFVVEQGGRVRVLRDGAILSTPFLDVSSLVSTSGEQGLLGLAFPPDYSATGRFYVYYASKGGASVLARYAVSAGDANVADQDSAEVLLQVPRKGVYHLGGQLAFGPDGFLYLASGDGGQGGAASRRLDSLEGKLLRLDVSGATGYAVPATNPFAATAGAQPEVWAFGLRNPWRFSFDRSTGDLYIADVGQDAYEEVDFQAADSKGGEDYGWNVMEGKHCYLAATCDRTGLTLPVLEYAHGAGTGKSITGGYVYRGKDLPGLVGSYVFGDFISGNVWRTSAAGGWALTPLVTGTGMMVVTFGEDVNGELYVADYLGGKVYRLSD